MSTINATYPTLLDVVRRQDPDGAQAKLVEMLTQQTPMLDDIPWIEGNLQNGHKFTMRDGLPTLVWRKMNQGVAPSKGSGSPVTEVCGQLSGRSNIDVDLVKLSKDGPAFRASEDAGFMVAFKNGLETSLFYESTKTNPDRIHGFSPRFDATTNPGGGQILLHDGSASGSDQASIWLVGWGPDTVSAFYPAGSMVGLEAKDMGEQYVLDSGGSNSFRAYSTDWKWNIGLMVRDWRYVVRIANVDTSALSTSGTAVIDSIIGAIEEKFQSTDNVRPVMYVNRKVSRYFRTQMQNKTANSTLSWDDVGGRKVMRFGEFVVRRTDALLNTEAIVA